MPNNLVIFPVGGSGGGPTTDIYAAARVVSLIPGQGTDLTLASAIAALAATGGDIYVKPGTYPIAATLTLPAGVFIRIRGAGNGRTGGAPQGATVLVVDPGIELFDCTSAIGASFADFMVIGDAGATDQAAFVVNASIDVIVERVDIGNTAAVDSLRTIVRTGSTPEVTFRDCKVVMPSLGGSPAGSSFWRGSVSGGLLTWDNVEVECAPPFGDPALDFIKATPDFTVIDSYFGAPSGFVQIITGKVIWTGFKLDNAEVYIGGENSRITACEFSAVGVSLNAPTVKIVGTRFNGPGHDPAVSLAQLTLYGVGLQGDYVISGCSFRGAGATNYAIDIRGVFLGGVFGTVIDGCIFDDHSLATITVRGISTYTVTGCLFRSAPLPILETDAICAGQIGDNAILASGDMTIISPNTIVNQWNTRTIVVDTALDIGQRTALVDASGLPIQITLPLAAAARYRQYTIKKIDATANTVTITPSGGELIDGALTVVIGAQYGSVTIQSDGTSWSIIVSDASVSGSDIYAATRVVSLIPGDGTDLTIAAALAALPAAGGSIYVKQGTYPIAATLVIPDKPVTIFGTGPGTILDLGANAIVLFEKTSVTKDFVVQNLNVIGTNVGGQTLLKGDAQTGLTKSSFLNVTAADLHKCFVTDADPKLMFVILDNFNFSSGHATPVFWEGGPGVITAQDVSFSGSITGPVSIIGDDIFGGDPNLVPLDLRVCDITNSLFLSGISISGSFSDCLIAGTIFAVAGATPDRWIDIAAGTNPPIIVGCRFDLANIEEIRTGASNGTVKGITGATVPRVTETGAADFNSYEDISLSSTILGAHSRVNQWNTQPITVNTTLDVTNRTALVDATAGAVTVTLPPAASAKYRKYVIKKTDASVNTVTIDAAGAELIDGALTAVIGIQYGSLTVQSNGTSWSIVVSDASGPFGIFAATRIVSLVPGEGTDLTIAAALAALSAEGGDIYVKPGTYPIPASLDFGSKNIRLRGAGTSRDFTVGPTTLVPAAGISLFKNGRACSIEDMIFLGDNATSQILYEDALGGGSEIRFARINTHDIGGIVRGSDAFNMPEVEFTDSYIEIPSGPGIPLADRYVWKGNQANGELVFNYVELFVTGAGATLMSGVTAGANGPTFRVVDSYVGGGGGGGSTNFWFAQQIEWTQFEIDNAQFEISGAFNTVVNCGFLDFSIKFKAVWNFISNSKFSQGGTGGLFFDAQLWFTGGFGGIPTESIVTGCLFYGNAASNYGIKVENVNPVAIANCIFEDQTLAGIFLTAGAAPNPSKASVTGCRFTVTIPVLEGDAANCEGVYDANKNFGGSVILGTLSIVDKVNVRNIAASLTLDYNHRTVLEDATGAARVVTLPTAASAKYRQYTVKKIDASVNTVTVDAAGAETIDGALTVVMTLQWERITIQSDGTAWFRID